MKARDTALDDIVSLSREQLVERWQSQYGTPPPKGISQKLMMRAMAYESQLRREGGVSAALSRRLARLANGAPVSAAAAPRTLKPGARLVREWNGRTHTVEVVDGGCVWDGTRYRSLSAVARAITGTRWSGPRFFGVGK